MAAFHPIEFYGIGLDRDVNIIRGTSDESPTSAASPNLETMSLPMSDATKDLVQRRPWFLPGSLHPPLHNPSSPTTSFVELIPEPAVANSVLEGQHVLAVAPDQTDPFRSIERVPNHLTPINRYVDSIERHERISYDLAAEIKFEKPWQDYLPCPGSGPLSAAGSTTSDCARKPGTAKPVIPPPLYAPPSPEPYQPVTPEPIQPRPQNDEPPLMIRRYLEDPHDPDWISIAQRLQRLQEMGDTDHQPWKRGLHNWNYSSASKDTNPDAPRSVGGGCLGKRSMPDWDGELNGIPLVLVPDDCENVSSAVDLSISSTVVREQREAMQYGRPRAHKVQRLHKRKMKSSQGSSSPVSATKELSWWR